MSVSLFAWNNSFPAIWIDMKFDIWPFVENMMRKFNLTRITGALHEYLYSFITIPRWIVMIMRNDLDKLYGENQNTHFMFNNIIRKFAPCIRWFGKVRYSLTGHRRLYNRRTSFTCWIHGATNTHCKYIVKGKAILLQAWTRPWGFQDFEASRFQDDRHMKLVSFVSPTHRLSLPQWNIPGTHFC